MSMISEQVKRLRDTAREFQSDYSGYEAYRVTKEMYAAADMLEMLSSKAREEKTGKWVKDDDGSKRCSSCGAVLEKDDAFWHNCYYCYHCGAKMEGVTNV